MTVLGLVFLFARIPRFLSIVYIHAPLVYDYQMVVRA